jgi:hypothetical protein
MAILVRTFGAFPHALWVLRHAMRLETMLQDIRYALRSSLRRPAFAILVVLTLGVGIGANSAMFIVNSALLQPLPYERPEELAYVFGAFKGGNQASISPPDFLDHRERQTLFSSLAARSPFGSAVISGRGTPDRAAARRARDRPDGAAVHVRAVARHQPRVLGWRRRCRGPREASRPR